MHTYVYALHNYTHTRVVQTHRFLIFQVFERLEIKSAHYSKRAYDQYYEDYPFKQAEREREERERMRERAIDRLGEENTLSYCYLIVLKLRQEPVEFPSIYQSLTPRSTADHQPTYDYDCSPHTSPTPPTPTAGCSRRLPGSTILLILPTKKNQLDFLPRWIIHIKNQW